MRRSCAVLVVLVVLLKVGVASATFCVFHNYWGISWADDSRHVVYHSFEVNYNDDYALLNQDGRHPSLLWSLDVDTKTTIQISGPPPVHVDPETGRVFVMDRRGLMTAERAGAPWKGPLTVGRASLSYNPEFKTLTARGWLDWNYYSVFSATTSEVLGRAGFSSDSGWSVITEGRYLDYYGDYKQTHVRRLDLWTGKNVRHPELGKEKIVYPWILRADSDQVAMFIFEDEVRVRTADGTYRPVRISTDLNDLRNASRLRGIVRFERGYQESLPANLSESRQFAWAVKGDEDCLIGFPYWKDTRIIPCGAGIVGISDRGLALLRVGKGEIEILDSEMGEIHSTSDDHLICAPPNSENREELRQRVELPDDLCVGIPKPIRYSVSNPAPPRPLNTPQDVNAVLLGGAAYVENASPEVLEDFRVEPKKRQTLAQWNGRDVLARRDGKLMLRLLDGEWMAIDGIHFFGRQIDLVMEAEVSPDGSKVAILYNAVNGLRNPLGVLVVYDRETGAEVARVEEFRECANMYGC